MTTLALIDPIAPLDFCWNETDIVILILVGFSVAYVFFHILQLVREEMGAVRRLRATGREAENMPKKEEPELPPIKNGRYR